MAPNSSSRAACSRCIQQRPQAARTLSSALFLSLLLLSSATCTAGSPRCKGKTKSSCQSEFSTTAAAAAASGRNPAHTSSDGLQHRQAQDRDSSSSSSRDARYEAHAVGINAKAEQLLPRKTSSDKGGYVEFLLFVSEAGSLPAFNDPQFGPVVIPVMPPAAGQQQQQSASQQQLGPAGDMMALLAQHKAQFLVSVGDKDHFGFLQQLPAQFRQRTFHLDRPEEMTVHAVESFYWTAIRAPLGGTTAEPLLSLFTPAYKSGVKIQVPYASLLAQSYQNWEWVIYDDSPPEHTETWEALSALRDRDPRVRIFKSDRNDAFIGSVKAKACHMAVGQLLIELDHDDTLTPDALELLRDALVANPDAGFFYTEAIELFEGTQQTVDYGDSWAFGQGAHYKMLYDGFWATGAIAPPLNDKTLRHIVGVPNHVRAWSRKAYLELGGHARGLPVADDYDLILRAIFKYPAVYVRHMTYIQYRQLDGSTFTFTRNALIQRLVNILSRHSDPQIHATLEGRGLRDVGRAGLQDFEVLWEDAAPTGPPLSRYFHRPTVSAPCDQPYFTVVIPTFNNTRQLQQAIASVYAQDYPNWELLIVGDKCPLLDKFMEQHKAAVIESGHVVRYYNMHNHGGPGLHAPLNLAVKVLAPSDWVAYLKQDGVWAPNHLSSLAAKVAEDPQRGYVFASLQVNGKVVLVSEPRQGLLDTSVVAHHRRLIENHGGWRPQAAVGPANDWELFSRWADEPWGATLTPSVMYKQHPQAEARADDHISVV